MPEIELNRSRVLSAVGEFESGGMSEHVRMDGEGDLGLLATAGKHFSESCRRDRCAGGGREDIRGEGLLLLLSTLYFSEGSKGRTLQGVGAGKSVFDSPHMEKSLREVYLFPFKRAQLRSPQAVTVGHLDHGGVSVAVTALFPSDISQVIDFVVREVLAFSSVAVFLSFWRECPIFTVWRHGFGKG